MAAEETVGVEQNDKIGQEDKPIDAECFTLEVLQIIKEAQQQHGLRHGDFQRYRQYCARRIRRIRKSLHFPQGTKHRVQPKKVTEDVLKDARFLYLPLVDAERAWASAMQLKAEANTEPRKRFHMVSRLRKAVHHADHLATLCESDKCDARTKLEAQAYANVMKASLHFEQERWKAAMELYTAARTIYEKLAGAFVDEVKDIYLQRCDELAPNIRYCDYNSGDESAIGDLRAMRLKSGLEDSLTSRLDELIEKTQERQAATLSEVTWRGRTVPVKNEKVRVFLMSLKESSAQLSSAESVEQKLSIYESLLKELIEAQQALRDELREDPTFKAVLRGQPIEGGRIPNSVYLHTYLAYLRQTNTVQRNLLLIALLKSSKASSDAPKKASKPQDVARLYDIIIQNLSEIGTLPGLDEDGDLAQELQVQTTGYKAFRGFYIAQACETNKKWKEALALYERVLTYARESMQGYSKVKLPDKDKEVAALESLVKEVEGLKYSCHASSILDSQDVSDSLTTTAVKNNKPLCDRLDVYQEDPSLTSKRPNLAHFPPDFQPIPCKPLFFDVALSLVEYPSLDDRLEQKKQAGGITGLVKGWLWGGGKK